MEKRDTLRKRRCCLYFLQFIPSPIFEALCKAGIISHETEDLFEEFEVEENEITSLTTMCELYSYILTNELIIKKLIYNEEVGSLRQID